MSVKEERKVRCAGNRATGSPAKAHETGRHPTEAYCASAVLICKVTFSEVHVDACGQYCWTVNNFRSNERVLGSCGWVRHHPATKIFIQ